MKIDAICERITSMSQTHGPCLKHTAHVSNTRPMSQTHGPCLKHTAHVSNTRPMSQTHGPCLKHTAHVSDTRPMFQTYPGWIKFGIIFTHKKTHRQVSQLSLANKKEIFTIWSKYSYIFTYTCIEAFSHLRVPQTYFLMGYWSPRTNNIPLNKNKT